MLSRRMILTTGAASAVVIGLGLGGVELRRRSLLATAREPWRRAGDDLGDVRLNALAFAILAPNPHNMQPWRFDLSEPETVSVYCDLSRRLPHTDPPDRQITIGFGCMLELLRIAAAEQGYAAEMTPFPDGEPQPRLDARPIARVRFRQGGGRPEPTMFAAIRERRTVRAPFDAERPVSQDMLDAIAAAAGETVVAGATIDATRLETLKDLALRAWEIEYRTDATRRESIDVMRIGAEAAARTPDGIALVEPIIEVGRLVGAVSPEALDTPGSAAFEQGLSMYADAIASSQGFFWLTTPDNTRRTQLEVGAAWVRAHLAAQRLGLCLHPLSQALQEFPEMAGPYAEIHERLGADAPGVVQMFARAGFARFPAPAPRWPLETTLIEDGA